MSTLNPTLASAPRITIIEPTIKRPTFSLVEANKLRVAAYARVSTEQDEQQSSYEAQVSYYTSYINNHEGWEFVEVFADEGISGTSTKKREGFQRMMAAAEAGKIDLILTKSISRFGRNTVDTLSAVRKLREKGIEVVFEKENLRTLDPKCEVMLTIMSSLAQEESRSISENVRWGKQKSMMDGKFAVAYKHFLGYQKGEDGRLEIVESEAAIVHKIYDLFLDGRTIRSIAEQLTREGIPTPAGKTIWSVSTIKSILSNEKYKGDALLQKTYVSDYLTKRVKRNQGEVQQVYLSNSHPAIIEPETFDLVQTELKRRSQDKSKLSNNSPFTTKIICMSCGEYFGHKVFHGNDKSRSDVWYCNHRYDGENKCDTPIIKESLLKASFLEALGQALAQSPAQNTPSVAALTKEANQHDQLIKARESAEKALEKATLELQALVADNTRRSQDQAEFLTKHQALSEKVELHKAALEKADTAIIEASGKKERQKRFLTATSDLCLDSLEYSDGLVSATLEKIKVSSIKNGKYILTFIFGNGQEIALER